MGYNYNYYYYHSLPFLPSLLTKGRVRVFNLTWARACARAHAREIRVDEDSNPVTSLPSAPLLASPQICQSLGR